MLFKVTGVKLTPGYRMKVNDYRMKVNELLHASLISAYRLT